MSFLSTNLRVLRNEQGLSQASLSEKLDVKRATYSAWEEDRGNPDVYMLIRISEFYEVSVTALMKTDMSSQKPQRLKENILMCRYNSSEDHVRGAIDTLLKII